MIVAIEEVQALLRRLGRINRTPLRKIVWTRRGKVIDVPPANIDEFEDTGLSNKDFVRYGFYKRLSAAIKPVSLRKED